MTTAAPLIEVRGLKKYFGSSDRPVRAVDDVSFAIQPGETVLLVDDLLATGGTAAAAVKLLEILGAKIVGISVLIELGFLDGREKLAPHKVNALLCY